MKMLEFDRSKLLNDLAGLPTPLQTAFAAACAQRLLVNYVAYAEDGARNADPAAVSNALETLWGMIENNRFDDALLAKQYDVCVSLLPDYKREYIQGQEEAEDAVLSIAYAIRMRVDADADFAVSAAEKAYDSLDHYLTEHHAIDISAPGARQKIDAYPLMQLEFRRQQADLAELHSAPKNAGSERAIISRMRRRAKRDAAPLDQLSLDQLRRRDGY